MQPPGGRFTHVDIRIAGNQAAQGILANRTRADRRPAPGRIGGVYIRAGA